MGKFEATQVTGGIVKDAAASKVNNDIVEFMLNGIYDSSEGSLGSVTTESGMEKQLPSDFLINSTSYKPVGSISLTPIKKVIFLTDDAGKEALVYFVQGTTTLIREFTGSEIMGFNTKYPIQGIGRIRRGTDEVLYWNDGVNPDRYIIVTKLESYLTAGVFNPDLTLFNQRFSPAQTELIQGFDTGGSFQLGAYRIALQYGDSLGNFTETFYISNPFFAVRGNYSGNDNQIRGGMNIISDNNANRSDAYDVVNKSFKFQFTSIDTNYEILKVFAVRYSDSTGTVEGVYEVRELNINQRDTIDWIFDGIAASAPASTLENLTASYARYSTSQAMHHIQNTLIRANLTEEPYDWAKFQRYVTNSAKVKWVVKDINIDDAVSTETRELDNKHAKGGFENQSIFRGDVQTIGCSVLMADGTKSPVFVIPGRPELASGETYTIGSQTYDPATHYSTLTDLGQRNTVAAGQSWDKANLTITKDETQPVTSLTLGLSIDPETEVTISNCTHAGAIEGGTVERWKVYNTAIDDDIADVESGYISSGICGFYEVDTTYPEVRDSEGEIIFPHDDDGAGNITMHKIRHHQFPDTDIAPHHSYNASNYRLPLLATAAGHHIHPMGIKVFDLELPPEYESKVAGIQFYYGDRTEDFIIADKGICLFTQTERKFGGESTAATAGTYYSLGGGVPTGGFNGNRIQFQSSGIQFDENYWSSASYIRVESLMPPSVSEENIDTIAEFKANGIRQYNVYNDITTLSSGNKMLQYLNRNINSFEYQGFGFNPQYNSDFGVVVSTQKELGINLVDGQPGLDPTDPPALISLYDKAAEFIGNNVFVPGSSYGHNDVTYGYTALRTNKQVFDNLPAIIFHSANGHFVPVGSTYDVNGRDCFIVRNYFMGQAYNQTDNSRWCYIHEYFSESKLNADLRHEGQDPFEIVYPIYTGDINDIYGFDSWGAPDGERQEEFNALNKDYAILPTINANFLLDLTLDWQSQQLGKFPVRIAWSGKSQDEELIDLNLTFAALDYDDLSTDKGEIRMLAQKPNALYAMTDYSIFLKPTNAQQLDLSLSTAFLKQSSFLDIPETELFDTGSGYGGCQHRLAHVHTEFGTMYVNQSGGEVYLLNKSVEPLDSRGLSQDLNTILPSKFLTTFKQVMGYEYPLYDSITNTDGLGVIVSYDPLWKRGILTKIDYEFLVDFEGAYDSSTALADILYWDVANETFVYNAVNVDLSDSRAITRSLFQRRNITLSYSFKDKKWASFHSWIPRFSFNDTEYLYSQPLQNQFMFKHVKHRYLEYYDEGVRFPFIVEFNTANMQKNFITQINWLTRVAVWNELKNRFLNKKDQTFTKMIMYTDYHTTGLLDLVNLQDNPFGQFSLANNEKYIKRHNHTWSANQLWDLRITSAEIEPAMTESLTNTTFTDNWYQGLTGGYIDKVENTLSYDYSKSLFNIPAIDNEFITTRLIYDSQFIDHKLTVDLISLYKQNDIL